MIQGKDETMGMSEGQRKRGSMDGETRESREKMLKVKLNVNI